MKIVFINFRKFRRRFLRPFAIISLVLASIILGLFIIDTYLTDSVAASGDVGKVIVIDAGHGGEDPGAIGEGSVYEKDLNLSIAMLVGEQLAKEGYTVVYTRTEDKMLYSPEENIKGMRKLSDLKNRVKIAEQYPDSLFISIHMNSFGDSAYSGAQVYYNAKNSESRLLAEKIKTSIKEQAQPDNTRTTKEGKGLYLLENNPSPAVIVECGFMTNNEELSRLLEKEYQNQLSFAIVCGIINYIGNK